MKNRFIAILAVLSILSLFFGCLMGHITGTQATLGAFMVASGAGMTMQLNVQGPCLGVTFTVSEILTGTIAAFKKKLPMLAKFSTRFTAEKVVLNGTLIGHIQTLPTASTFDNTTGYANGATEAGSLLTDVPVTVDQHPHVPIKITNLTELAAQKSTYQGQIESAAYVLAKAVVDNVLTKFGSGNSSYTSTETINNTDRDTLGDVRKDMNGQGAGDERYGMCNSDFAEKLDTDSRIASKDYYGQQTGENPYLVVKAVAGFREIWEYPDLPALASSPGTFTVNASTNVVTVSAAHGLVVGDRVRVSSATTLPAGLAAATDYFVISVPSTTTLTLSATSGGSVVDITDTGTGTHTITRYENNSAIFFDPRGVVLVTGLPNHNFDLAAQLGIPQVMKQEIVQDPETGLAFMGLLWQQQGTGDIYLTVTLMFGSAVGRQAGAAGAICDKAIHRVITA